jgi:ribonuclease BN (tRNA processing enzyme)
MTEYENEKKITFDYLNLTPFAVEHGNMPAFALKFEFNKKTLVYSGDSKDCQGLKDACQNADTLLLDTNDKINSLDSPTGHLNAITAGSIAKDSCSKQLILTHLTGENSEKELIDAVKSSGFEGEITIASDFLFLDL